MMADLASIRSLPQLRRRLAQKKSRALTDFQRHLVRADRGCLSEHASEAVGTFEKARTASETSFGPIVS